MKCHLETTLLLISWLTKATSPPLILRRQVHYLWFDCAWHRPALFLVQSIFHLRAFLHDCQSVYKTVLCAIQPALIHDPAATFSASRLPAGDGRPRRRPLSDVSGQVTGNTNESNFTMSREVDQNGTNGQNSQSGTRASRSIPLR